MKHALPILAAVVTLLAAPAAHAVRLAAPGAPQHGVAPFPRLLPGQGATPAVAAKVNAALARDEALALKAARECTADARQARGKIAPAEAWERAVQVTMNGPRFLAYTVMDSYDCGGPYPNDGIQSQWVFDLSTGRPVDWLALFPKGKGVEGARSTAPDGAVTGVVRWAELSRRAEAQAEGDCQGTFTDVQHTFNVTLTGGRGAALVASPDDLPHVVHACAEDVVIPADELAKLGFAPDLVAAVQAAKRAPVLRR